MGAHQVVSPRPVQGPAHGRADRRERSLAAEEVQHVRALLLDGGHRVDETICRESPKVTGLAAAARVERGSVEDDGALFREDGGDARFEFLQSTVGLVEEFGHGVFLCRAVYFKMRRMTTNIHADLEREVIKQLKGGEDKDDLILFVCERAGMNWNEAEEFVDDIEATHRHSITLSQSPLLVGLALTTFLGGVAIITYAASDLFGTLQSLAQADPRDLGTITGSATYIYFFGAQVGGLILIGIAMIAGSMKGMRSVWEAILAKMGIY